MQGFGEIQPERVRDPILVGSYDSAGHGAWYAGEMPEEASMPVIVFVPGLGQPASSFWSDSEPYGVNTLYAMAVKDGFRTAFAGFMADGEKPLDMWENGRMFAWQLKEICAYYKTDRVAVVAHSKGGVDAQTAAVYYGGAPYIQRIITLSTPHWGSQLADIAYSTAGWPLAELLGQHSRGCFCMQTGYMRDYRRSTDNHKRNTVPIETFAGNGSAPPLTKIWAGMQIMAQFGENDGVVTVKSAQNPKGRHIATLPLNHRQMQEGRFIWKYLRAHLLGETLRPAAMEAAAALPPPCGMVLRGSAVTGRYEEFLVEKGVTAFEVIISCGFSCGGPEPSFRLASPDDSEISGFVSHGSLGAVSFLTARVEDPPDGRWRIKAPEGVKYLAVIRLFGSFSLYPDERNASGQEGRGIRDLETTVRILRTYPDRYEVVCEHRLRPDEEAPPINIDEGCYNLETSVRGELEDGSLFERDALRPVVVKKGRSREV